MVLVYPKEKAADVLEALQPIAGYEGVGPLLIGTPVESTDGRYAHVHPLTEEETDFCTARLYGIAGAVVQEAMPEDWVTLNVDSNEQINQKEL